MNPNDRQWAAEEACINGFPALRQVLVGGWLLRISGSTRRTANSATPLPYRQAEPDAVIAACEALYRRHGRPAIFRIPSYLDPDFERRLAALGYTAEGHSRVIRGGIEVIMAAVPAGVRLSPQPTPEWLAAIAKLQQQTPEQHAVYRRVVGSIMLPAAFATAEDDGDVVAMAFGVIHRGLLCYESVVTDTARRRRGHARRVLAALARWARAEGAIGACLQVEADNAAGHALYDAVGMTEELHRYCYRRQPPAVA